MQRMPQRTQRRFLHRFAQRRMGVDGAGDVFQSGAHFQALAECGRQLRYAHAHRLPADNQMIVTPFLGGDVTVGYADIESMEWTGFRKGTGYRDLAIYVGGRKVVTLVGVLDLEQVLVRINRFDVLGRSSSR